jgi:predicted ribosome quality control (RQC) complex YloA/Tae2 family protein
MKAALSSADLRALVAEWQGLLGGHVDKAYQRGDEVILRLNPPGGGHAELYFKAGRWLCLHEVEERPQEPPPFAQALRRLLDNARIVGVEQRGFDRIAVFHVERGDETLQIVFEVFGKGNLVVTKADTTVACLSPQAYKDRAVQPGEPYAFPAAGINPIDLDRRGFADAVRNAKGQVVRVLASVLNLGGQSAEELCLLAGVPKEAKVRDLADGQLDALYTALNNLVVAIDTERRPVVILKDGRPWDAVPIDLAQYRGMGAQPFPTFNEALSHYIEAAPPEDASPADVSGKYERRIAQQEESLRALREEAALLEALAVFLYAHYEPFDEFLRAVRAGQDPPPHAQVKAIDRKARTVTFAIADFDAVTLEYEKDVTANGQALYDRRKEAQLKAQRVEEAIEATRREMEAARRKAVKVARKPRVRPTKAMWFEAYRWTLSSEGHLILGGRDARSNDQLVKKHLKEGDRYAHADVHGAPSTVVKEGSRAGEATLREACEFALAYSKAWSAGLASGSAYWVLPEQVSKQAESGEFLPRGAFVIRGKRNYLHDLPVRIAVGEVDVEGHRKVMGGPASAVEARAVRYVVLRPGKGDREALAKRLAAAFDVPIEEVGRVLPPAGCEVVETKDVPLAAGPPASSS